MHNGDMQPQYGYMYVVYVAHEKTDILHLTGLHQMINNKFTS